MGQPKILSNWTLSIDGIGYVGKAERFVPPELEEITEEVKGCGTMCATEVTVGYQPLKCEITLLELSALPYQLFGLRGTNGVVILSSSMSNDEEVQPVEMVLTGRFTKISLDDFENQSIVRQKISMTVKKMVMTINNQPVSVVDTENNVLNLNGVNDKLLEVRNYLGI